MQEKNNMLDFVGGGGRTPRSPDGKGTKKGKPNTGV